MKKIIAIMLGICLCFSFAGCSNDETVTVSKSFIESNEQSESTEGEGAVTESEVAVEYKDSDIYFEYTTDEYSVITFNGTTATATGLGVKVSDENVTITEKGVYVLEGFFKGTLNIDLGEEDKKVYLVLNNVTIEGTDGPAIYETNADKVIIMLPEGTVNNLSDAAVYSDTSEDAPTGALYCQDSLTINGIGTLNVTGNNNDGIVSKDNLKIMSGTINIETVDDGIVGRDLLAIKDGAITINAAGHAIKTTNDEDDEKGNALIEGGTFSITSGVDGINVVNVLEIKNAVMTISSGDDGIHADDTLIINSGVIDITKSYEGLEAVLIYINDGTINIVASDDGINANGGNDGSGFMGMFSKDSFSSSSASDNYSCIYINGGSVYVNADGDGIDSNGDIKMTGGYVFVSGPDNDGNNATDYQDTFLMNGGLIIATGTMGMYQSISSSSECYAIDYFSDSYISENTECALYDKDTQVLSFTNLKRANAILIAGDALENEKEYTLVIGSEAVAVTAGEGSLNGISMGGIRNDDKTAPKMPDGTAPKMPEGTENMTPPEGMEIPEGMENMTPPEGMEMPEGMENMTPPEGMEMPEGMESMTPPADMEKQDGMQNMTIPDNSANF